MALWKAVKYLALAVGLVVLISGAVSLLTWLFVSVIWPLLVTAAILLSAAAVTYVVVKGALWLLDDRNRATEPATAESGKQDPIDSLNERYVNGDLTEAEFERRLEDELDDGGRDEIDRELERAQSN